MPEIPRFEQAPTSAAWKWPLAFTENKQENKKTEVDFALRTGEDLPAATRWLQGRFDFGNIRPVTAFSKAKSGLGAPIFEKVIYGVKSCLVSMELAYLLD
jgi:hypothetical protein